MVDKTSSVRRVRGVSASRRTEVIGDATLYLGDCMEIMPSVGEVDAVVTDPPYGISMDAAGARAKGNHGWTDHGDASWDTSRPPDDVMKFILALRVPTIIWGGNYFIDLLTPGTKWLVWDKCQTEFSLADCELAWCSWEGAVRRMALSRGAALQDGKEHPTQKALEIMTWCLSQLPNRTGGVVLDPFMGSGTTGVATINAGKQFIGIERELKYFDIACRRIEKEHKCGDFMKDTHGMSNKTSQAVFLSTAVARPRARRVTR